MRIWTYKNADEKAHTFSRRSKNVKKLTKTYEKRILCKFTFKTRLVLYYAITVLPDWPETTDWATFDWLTRVNFLIRGFWASFVNVLGVIGLFGRIFWLAFTNRLYR